MQSALIGQLTQVWASTAYSNKAGVLNKFWPLISTGYVSAALHLIGFTLVCVNFHKVCCAAAVRSPLWTDTQDFYIWQMLEHDAAIQLNLAPSRQEVKHWNNNITSGYFSK